MNKCNVSKLSKNIYLTTMKLIKILYCYTFRSSWISWPLAFLFQGVFDDKEGNDVPVRLVI